MVVDVPPGVTMPNDVGALKPPPPPPPAAPAAPAPAGAPPGCAGSVVATRKGPWRGIVNRMVRPDASIFEGILNPSPWVSAFGAAPARAA